MEAEPIKYALHISDTKTRRWPSLPADEATVSSRIQLMLYHRLLSGVLSIAQPAADAHHRLDFNTVWQRAGVNPTLKFSEDFIKQAGLTTGKCQLHRGPVPPLFNLSCLDDLTWAWQQAVEALNVTGIDDTLTIVYRLRPRRASSLASPDRSKTPERPKGRLKSKDRSKGKGKSRSKRSAARADDADGSEDLSEREVRDIAAALQASVSDLGPGGGGDADLALAVFASLEDAIRSGRSTGGGLGTP